MVVLLLLVDGFRIARPPWVPNPDSCYSITILISSIFTSYPFTLYRSICVYIHTHGYKSLPVLVIPAIAILILIVLGVIKKVTSRVFYRQRSKIVQMSRKEIIVGSPLRIYQIKYCWCFKTISFLSLVGPTLLNLLPSLTSQWLEATNIAGVSLVRVSLKLINQ